MINGARDINTYDPVVTCWISNCKNTPTISGVYMGIESDLAYGHRISYCPDHSTSGYNADWMNVYCKEVKSVSDLSRFTAEDFFKELD